MRPHPRIKVRTLMLVIAAIACVIGGSIEWWNHRQRDQSLKSALEPYERATWHYLQLRDCTSNEGRVPYRVSERATVIDEFMGPGYSKASFGANFFEGWAAEANWHRHWSERLMDSLGTRSLERRRLEHRMLIP
jgi:hypothetical protein